MKLQEIVDVLKAEVVSSADNMDTEIQTACGSDMMSSDVLAFAKTQSVFLTGLMNPQVVRTAEMMRICAPLFLCVESRWMTWWSPWQSKKGSASSRRVLPCLLPVACCMSEESEERVNGNEGFNTRISCAG